MKLNDTGGIQWQKSLGGTADDKAFDIRQTADGGYMVAGSTASNDGDVSGNHGGVNYWAVKLNDTGGVLWQKCYGGTGGDFCAAIQQTTDGGYIMIGNTASFDGEVTGNHDSYDYWVVKIKDTGAIQWEKCYGGTAEDDGQAIQQTTDGGYIMAGYTASNNGDVSGNHGGDFDGWIVKINNLGGIEWQICIGGSRIDGAFAIQKTFDGGYIVAGSTESNDGDASGLHSFFTDCWVIKLNDTGCIQWQKCMGGSSADGALSIQQTVDSGYIIAGSTESNDGDVTGLHGIIDYWTVKLHNETKTELQIIPMGLLSGLMPNPTTGIIYLSVPAATIKVSNALGRCIKEASNTSTISISEFSSGWYFIEAFNDTGQLILHDKIFKQ